MVEESGSYSSNRKFQGNKEVIHIKTVKASFLPACEAKFTQSIIYPISTNRKKVQQPYPQIKGNNS